MPHRLLAVLPVVALAALAVPAATATPAPPPSLVRDVDSLPTSELGVLGFFSQFAELGDQLFFGQNDGIHGRELWVTDGTEAGTHLVIDLCPGHCSSWIAELAAAGDRVYFTGDDGVHGRELWTTDGTPAGTRLVLDAVPGLGSSTPGGFVPLGDQVLYTAFDPAHGRELWISDGTADGTVRVDIEPGTGSSSPDGMIALPSGVFFTATDTTRGREPWFSDGTVAGTAPLLDVYPGSASSIYNGPVRYGPGRNVFGASGTVYFMADDGLHGRETWITDGTTGGTRLLADLDPGGSSDPHGFVEMGGRIYFTPRTPSEGRSLWVTDGVSDTHLVADPTDDFEGPVMLGAAGSKLFFLIHTASDGLELWTSDGSAAGTSAVIDVSTGGPWDFSWRYALSATTLSDRLFFFLDDGTSGLEPWITDGTGGGTFRLRDVDPGGDGSYPFLFSYVIPFIRGASAYFFAQDGTGLDPWRTNGTTTGTERLKDIDTQASSLPDPSFFALRPAVASTGKLFCGLQDGEHGVEPWVSGGTAGTTLLLADADPAPDPQAGSYPENVIAWEDGILFDAQIGGERRLWRSDGTPARTFEIAAMGAPGLTAALGAAFFAGEGPDGRELWSTDGTSAGTHQVADLMPGFRDSSPARFVAATGGLVFTASDSRGRELWRSDGTAAGTRQLADLVPGAESSYPESLVAIGDQVCFTAERPADGRELWCSDGSAAGTTRILDLNPGVASAFVDDFEADVGDVAEIAAAPGGMFLVADDGAHGTEPWWSDGTEDGTRLIADLRAGSRSSEPRMLIVLDGRAFFAADDGVHGRELWTSDGTEAGTRLVTDLVPGAGSSLPQWLTPVDGVLYFSAFRPDVGVELWRTDGTEAGTELVADVYPGAEPSTPEFLTVAGRRLFFTANDGEHGFEPWALLLPGRLPKMSLSWSGTPLPGKVLDFVLVLTNPPPRPMPDGDDDELTLPLPAELVYLGDGLATAGALQFFGVSAGADTAAAAAEPFTLGGGTLTWNGELAPGGSVTITFRARIRPDVPLGASLALLADGSLDSDEDGSSDFRYTSDDPAAPGGDDPTTIRVAPLVAGIPALGTAGLVLLALLFTAVAVRRLIR